MPIKHLEPRNSVVGKVKRAARSLQKGKKARKIATFLLTLAVAGAILGTVAVAGALAWYSRDLPDPNTLMTREVPQSTKIYDRTGETLLFEIHGDEQRTLVPLSEIPEYSQWATIAIEDRDFYNHHGIYWRGLLRAFTLGLIQSQRVQGTSTLTQQFVKNAILTNERSIIRKLKEFVLSIQIERVYTKDEILQLYLNEIPYGSTYYGIESAAQGYFGKSAKDLTLDEAALLAALPQSPTRYSPYGTSASGDNRDLLVGRQHLVLQRMAEQGYITEEEAVAAQEVDTLEKIVPRQVGDIRAPHFVEYVRTQLIEEYGQRTVEQGGLKVITTLDWEKQQIAEEEVELGVEARGETYGFTNAALVSLDPKSGNILAMVGSHDFWDDENDGQVNVSLRPRQPGSSFKPIVYTAAFLKGYTPEMTLWDVDTVFKTDIGTYAPRNYSLDENGPVSAREALQRSLNTPAVKLLYLVGVPRVLDFAESLGYTTLQDRSRFGLSLVLGGGEVTLLEHAHAYSTFAASGEQAPVASILRVEAPDGEVLEEWEEPRPKRIFHEDAAHALSSILTGTSVQLSGRPVAAKTGTTNNFHDAWTMGYTPSLVTGVWVGNSNNDAMVRGAAGATVASPIFKAYMNRALAGTPVEAFPPAPAISTEKPILAGQGAERTVKVDTVSGKLATEFTPSEFIEERTYYEAHSELWYIDKDDPLGPPPSNPGDDPQFTNWEEAVRRWAAEHEWHTTSTPPTEYDDVHTPENRPDITIQDPIKNETWDSREEVIRVKASAPRGIVRIEAKINGTLIGASAGQQTIPVVVPNSIPVGFHEVEVTAYDDVGNRGSDRVVINLKASEGSGGGGEALILYPSAGEQINRNSFPQNISLILANPNDLEQVSVYLHEIPNGSTRLLASEIGPTASALTVSWNVAPEKGKYEIYTVVRKHDGDIITGPRSTITIK